MPYYLVIFGAAVRPDGSPSGTLERRIAGAIAAGRRMPGARYMLTGGRGGSGYIEADVMREMLVAAGVTPADIVCEREARDTLESVRNCDVMLRALGDAKVLVPCTSPYHVPRCALLLRLLGWTVETAPMPGDAKVLPWKKLVWYHVKELIALPYDVLLLLVQRRTSAR